MLAVLQGGFLYEISDQMSRPPITQRHDELREEFIETDRVFVKVFRRSTWIEALLRQVQPAIHVHDHRRNTVKREMCLELAREITLPTPINPTNTDKQAARVRNGRAPLADFSNYFVYAVHLTSVHLRKAAVKNVTDSRRC